MKNIIFANSDWLYSCANCAELGKREKEPSGSLKQIAWKCKDSRWTKIYDPAHECCGNYRGRKGR